MNNLKTAALLAFLSALVWGVAFAWGGMDGFWVGLVLVGFMNFAAYFWSDKIALAATRARPVEEHQLPNVYSIVRNLTSRANMPMPRIYLIDSPQPNAFATGRNPEHAAVAVTTGILQILTDGELEGVLGHELAHVKNRDILISSVAAMLAAALSIFARMAFWFGGGSRDRNNPRRGGHRADLDHPRPDRRHAHPARHLPNSRVRSRHLGGGADRTSADVGVGPGEDRRRHCAPSHERQPGCQPALHRQSAKSGEGSEPEPAVLHPSSDRGADPAPARPGVGDPVTLDIPASMAVIAVVVVAVIAWGAWFSAGSARHGPSWALTQLQRWRPMARSLGALGVIITVAVEPIWLGVAVVFVAAVTWWLTRTVRNRLEAFRNTYGEFDESP